MRGWTTIKKFKLVIGFVDSSYWDDGNRSTSVTRSFVLRGARDAEARILRKSGVVRTQGQEGPVRNFRIQSMRKVDEATSSREVNL